MIAKKSDGLDYLRENKLALGNSVSTCYCDETNTSSPAVYYTASSLGAKANA